MRECSKIDDNIFELYKNILIVEYDEVYNNKLSQKLDTLDYVVNSAYSYDDVMSYIKEEKYDYIIVNLDSDTSEHNELLNFLKITTNSKLMVLSESLDTQYQEYLYFNGIIQFLQKKQPIDELIDIINSSIKSISSRFILNEILLIQKSNFVVEQIQNLLIPRDYKLSIKQNSVDVISLIEKSDITTIIIDLEMCSVDPIKLIENIKGLNRQHIPILVLSGANDLTSQEKILQLGVSDIIRKPISSKELIFKVDFWTKYFRQEYSLLCQQKILNEYKEIVDKASIVSKTNPKGIITYVNEKFCQISGYSEYELVGKPHNIVRHEDMPKAAFEDMWDTIKNKKKIWQGKVKNKTKSGDYYVVQTFIKPVLNVNGEVQEYIALRNDITELEKYKEVLKSQLDDTSRSLNENVNYTRQYESAINNTVAVIKTDLNNVITYSNDEFCKISGYNERELIGMNCEKLRDRKHILNSDCENIKQKLNNKEKVKILFTNIGKDGKPYYVDTSINAILDIEGEVIEHLHIMNDVSELRDLHVELEDTQKEIIYKMGEIGETRSKETGHHVKRVALYSELLAKLYGLSDEKAALLNLASPMHDIGKIAIPDAVLNKPGRLNKEEFEIIKTHAATGYEMLNHSTRPILQTAAIVAYEHHERWDGKGYPRGIKEDEIHIYGRITAIVDVFDALGSQRCYKPAWSLEKIINLYREEKGKQFDPLLVDLFLDNLDKFLEIRDKFVD
ncbi:MAG: PAS domain S-box protein [Campylobacterota bacterium]|nr:PAS domain S-box protein [Campylobacterota bacterium]